MRVIITAISAKNIHKTLAPWCLKAYCDVHNPEAEILVEEYNINQPVQEVVDGIYQEKPDVIGFSCYIWNIEFVQKTAAMLRQLLPEAIIAVGGPEVSFDEDYPFADYVIWGAGEAAFSGLISGIACGNPPEKGIIQKAPPPFHALPSPYTESYFASFDKDKMGGMQNLLVYYESMRGCPFSCAYCLSSQTQGVECHPIERTERELALFVEKGAKCIKFIDRTFNANSRYAKAIFRFIQSLETDCTFHFEAAADLFDEESLALIAEMPKGRVQFEIGVQSVNDETLNEVSRKTDTSKVLAGISALVQTGKCHVHADLIAGLPYDTLETFARAVDELTEVRPHMLQLGFLKFLKGSRLRENAEQYGYKYNGYPPYQVLESKWMRPEDFIVLRNIESVIDKFYNTGKFKNSVEYALTELFSGAFAFFKALADYCLGKNIKISLKNSYTLLYAFLKSHGDSAKAAHVIKLDCMTFDPKGQLPDEIPSMRDREAEAEYRKTHKGAKLRIEYFPYDDKTRIFIY